MPNTVTLLHVHYQSIHKMHYFLQCSTSLKVIPLNFLLPQSNHRWNIELRQKYMRRLDNVTIDQCESIPFRDILSFPHREPFRKPLFHPIPNHY